MPSFDVSQERVLALDHTRHARVLGAPGSGKSTLVAETYAMLLERPGWGEHDVLVLAPNRVVASLLRQRIELRVSRALGGTPVRTPASYSFSVLNRFAALQGVPAPKLLTGTAHDRVIGQVLSTALAQGQLPELLERFSAEVVLGEMFRSEIRDLARVIDDYGMSAAMLSQHFAKSADPLAASNDRTPSASQRELWQAAARVCAAVQSEVTATRPDEMSSSELLARAAVAIRGDDTVPVPKLVVIDDAQELGEGALAVLAALALRGTSVWVFGDPDLATGAFQGERTVVLGGLSAELHRRGAPAGSSEQTVVLEQVHRHTHALRELVQQLTSRIGTAGAGAQRAAQAATPLHADVSADTDLTDGEHLSDIRAERRAHREPRSEQGKTCQVEFSVVSSVTEQLGAVAHRLRRRHLGISTGNEIPWNSMAVICRSRAEVARAARTLAGHQVPTNVASGGLVLRESQLVRELILLTQFACGLTELHAREIWDFLSGAVGGVDPIALRRLRAEVRLQEQRAARTENREPASVDALVSAYFCDPSDTPLVDARSGRQLRRLAQVAARARALHERGGTVREVLWEIWEGVNLAESLQRTALDLRGAPADQAHHTLDAVLGLFFALQRHEEQDSAQPVSELLEELLSSAVAEDTLAARSERECVTITTPQGAVGMEFSVVCVLGPQDGNWPNLRSRGSLLEITALERWLRGGTPAQPARRDTLHDELRLFVQSCSRATDELLVVAVADEDHHPSPFFGFGRPYLRTTALPSSRLTVRGAVAEMRRRLTADPNDSLALRSIAALAEVHAPGAHPDEWYGVAPISSDQPLTDLEADPNLLVSVSPSRMEAAERCPLDWVISQLGGAPAGAVQQLGTLLHFAFERGDQLTTAEEIFAEVASQWSQLSFEAEWQSQHYLENAKEMAVGIADYLSEFAQSSRTLVGTEVPLKLQIGRALLNGTADRIESIERSDGERELSVVDLKTGRSFPSANDIAEHAQLQAYQLGIEAGGYQLPDAAADTDATLGGANGGARLLYVDPGVRTSKGSDAGSRFRVAAQPQLTDEARTVFIERVAAAAEIMAAGTFTAKIEHHCSDPHALGGACALHIIPGVSHA